MARARAYRLEVLLGLRREAERAAVAGLAAGLARLEREQRELCGREERLRGLERAALETGGPLAGASGETLAWSARLRHRLRCERGVQTKLCQEQRAQAREAEAAAERAMAVLATARGERRHLEGHRERWAAGLRAARGRALEAEMDDLAPLRPGRA
jgi:hypothetical protein